MRVRLVFKDRLILRRPRRHVVNRAFEVYSRQPGHAYLLAAFLSAVPGFFRLLSSECLALLPSLIKNQAAQPDFLRQPADLSKTLPLRTE